MAKFNDFKIDVKPSTNRKVFFRGNVTSVLEDASPEKTSSADLKVALIDQGPVNATKDESAGIGGVGGIVQIHVESIDAHDFQSRKEFDSESLEGLAKSIKVNGVVTPLKVIKVGNRYQVASGERRLRAAKMAGLDHLPCIIIDEKKAMVESVIENLQRENLNIFEEGRDYLKLLENGVYKNQTEMSQDLGVPYSRISETLNFYKSIRLEDQEMLLRKGKISRQQLRDFLKNSAGKSEKKSQFAAFQLKITLRNDSVESHLGDYRALSDKERGMLAEELVKIVELLKT